LILKKKKKSRNRFIIAIHVASFMKQYQ